MGKVISNYPIPTIESLLARLEGCKYFSILDLRSGYHHIGLSGQSKHLTAFTTHSGKFQWNVLPFGIGIGVQTFSFVINKAIGHCSDFAANHFLKNHRRSYGTSGENLQSITSRRLEDQGIKV